MPETGFAFALDILENRGFNASSLLIALLSLITSVITGVLTYLTLRLTARNSAAASSAPAPRRPTRTSEPRRTEAAPYKWPVIVGLIVGVVVGCFNLANPGVVQDRIDRMIAVVLQTARMEISPDHASVGERVQVKIHNLGRYESFKLYVSQHITPTIMTTPPEWSADLEADGDGEFAGEVEVPSGIVPGEWTNVVVNRPSQDGTPKQILTERLYVTR